MRYFFGFLITIGLLILLIIMLISGGDKKAEVPKTGKPLSSYASTGAEVRMTIDGPVNADSEHQGLRITVGRDNVIYEQLSGYNGDVVERQSFANSETAYVTFLRALSLAGFTKGDPDKNLANERGYCATGSRYIFELRDGGDMLQRYWTSDCGNVKTYLGNLTATRDLFQVQVPGFADLVDDVEL